MTAPFAGRVALVTGAGRGIGRAIALELASGGASLALMARSQDELEEVATTVRELGGSAGIFPADVADPAQIAAATTCVAEGLGVVDILVNNAAVVTPLGPTVGVAPAEWIGAFQVNVAAVFRLTMTLLPAMLGRGWGRIVNVSSGIAAHPGAMVGMNVYATTKAALEAHTINLAAELAGTGVTVNAYRPGSVDTAMQAWIRGQPAEVIGAALRQRFIDTYARGTLITPQQSARSLVPRLTGVETGQIWEAAAAVAVPNSRPGDS